MSSIVIPILDRRRACVVYRISSMQCDSYRRDMERTRHLGRLVRLSIWFRENYESQHKLMDTFSYLMKYPQLGNFLIFLWNEEMIFIRKSKWNLARSRWRSSRTRAAFIVLVEKVGERWFSSQSASKTRWCDRNDAKDTMLFLKISVATNEVAEWSYTGADRRLKTCRALLWPSDGDV